MLLGVITLLPAFAQESPRVAISKIITTVNNFAAKQKVEKLYLQTDKPAYAVGDTLRFKAYLLETPYLGAAQKSGILYVEIVNDANAVIKRTMLPVYHGVTFGNITLDDKEMPQGGYILRAYTNWMRNFSENYIFKKHFYIGNAANNDWLIDYRAGAVKNDGRDKVQLDLRFKQFDMIPVALREMQLRLTDGNRTLLKSNINTDMDGGVGVNFNLPEKADLKNLSLSIQDNRKGEGNRKLLMPLILNRPDHIDLQFMPEGGGLIAGLPTRVAFKAVNEDGYGADVAGKVYNSKQQEVAVFSSAHKGIGEFNMQPQAGEVYSAKIKLPDGAYKTFPLPLVKASGISLRVNNPFKSDSIEVVLTATSDMVVPGPVYLMGHSLGIVCYGALVRFKNGASKFMISKKVFPTGMVYFTLIGADKKALNERMIYIDHQDDLRIQVAGDKPAYQQREHVALNITVADAGGAPVQGSFSLAVTDDGQVKTDSIGNGSIVTHMLLTADLKGTVEDPGYYYHSASDSRKWQDLDQLLLAQGWVSYNWNDAFAPVKPVLYAAEKEYLIKGRVTNTFNKPVPKSGVTLFSRKPMLITDTLTNEQGAFTFKGIFPADTAVYFVQAKNKKGKSFNVGIEMDEFKPPVFAAAYERIRPWYLNIDTNKLTTLKKQAVLKENLEKISTGRVLKEVVIKGKSIIKDSKNLNGPGEADVVIDDEELKKAGRATLGDLLEKRVKGFGYKADKTGQLYYSIGFLTMHLIIDGMDTEFFRPEGISSYEYFKQYFDYYDAEEIKGIEVMTKSSHAMSYVSRFLDPMVTSFDHAFIEVTTRSGHGPFVKKAVGTYVYRPMPFTVPKLFYAPKYTAESIPDMTDIRSTIHWEPNVVTDKDGKVTISFYTADNPGKYTFIIEGTDLAGSVGIKTGSIAVKKR